MAKRNDDAQRIAHIAATTYRPIINDDRIVEGGGDKLKGNHFLRPELVEASKTDRVISTIGATYGEMREGFAKLKTLLTRHDPARTPVAEYVHYAGIANKFMDNIIIAKKNADLTATTELNAINNDISRTLRIGTNSDMAREIREHLKDDDNRVATIHDAITRGEVDIVSAVYPLPLC